MPETVRSAFADRPRPLLSYGIPFPTACAHHAKATFNASRVYVIVSGTLGRSTDVLERLEQALGKGVIVGTRIGMKSHTLWSEVLEIVHDARSKEADLLVTLGGGSLTDGAKVVALALSNNVTSPETLLPLAVGPTQSPDIHPPSIPIISIPTSLSAGEYSNFAGATNDSTHRKHSFQAPLKGPQLVILDPALAATTPASIWLSTGIRAVDHCVETFCQVKNTTEETDGLALHALGLLVPGLLKCKYDYDKDHEGGSGEKELDLEARLQCQLGSVDAMAACTNSRAVVQLGASHGIGHQLGPLGVPHGVTSCILLPAVCKYNAKYSSNGPKQAHLRSFLAKQPVVRSVLAKRGINAESESSDLGDVLDAVIRELGLPRTLKEVGVGREKLDGLAEHSLTDRWCKSNPVPLVEKAQVLEILEMVVE